jgi:hypothetical protein
MAKILQKLIMWLRFTLDHKGRHIEIGIFEIGISFLNQE